MTHRPSTRLQNANDSHFKVSLCDRLAARGVRLTTRRRVLLEILEESGPHLDAAALLQAAKKRIPMDQATVYRTLELLKKEGLVDELDLMHLQGEMHYYEVRTEKEHFHLACFRCGQIQEIETSLFDELKKYVATKSGFAIETARLEIGGYCARCARHAQRANSRIAHRGARM